MSFLQNQKVHNSLVSGSYEHIQGIRKVVVLRCEDLENVFRSLKSTKIS